MHDINGYKKQTLQKVSKASRKHLAVNMKRRSELYLQEAPHIIDIIHSEKWKKQFKKPFENLPQGTKISTKRYLQQNLRVLFTPRPFALFAFALSETLPALVNTFPLH